MARLPDATSLGQRPVPQSRQQVVTDQSGQILAQGVSSLGESLQRIGSEFEDRQSQLEATQARSKLLVADIQTRQELQNDPDWKTYEQRYRDKMASAIDSTSSSISSIRARQMFQAQAQLDLARGSAAMSEEAQKKRVDIGHANTITSLDALRTAALSASDEGTRAAAVGAAHQMIDASVTNGDLSPEQGATVKKQWTASYSEGAVSMLPYDRQIALLSKPQGTSAEFLAPDKREEMLQHAILAKQVEEHRALELQKQQQEEQQKATQNQFLARMQSNALTPQDVLHSNLAPFGSGSKDEFLNMLKAQATKPIKTDPALFNELFARAHVPDGTPGKLVNENQLNPYLIAGRIDMEDLTKLRNEIQGQNTTDGKNESLLKEGLLRVAKSTLTRTNPLLGIQDPEGEANLQRYTTWFLSEYDKQRQAGKSAAELLSPDSPDYLGKRLQGFVRSGMDIMQDQLGSFTKAPGTSATPRKDGESQDEYLKRIGK